MITSSISQQNRLPNGIRQWSTNTGLVMAPMQTVNTFGKIKITTQYDNQYSEFITTLGEKKNILQQRVNGELRNNPNYQGSRRQGVLLAWEYEKADIEMGGKGSADWNGSQREEIKEAGSARGAEGHHQKNVADHIEHQANPDNIKFYKDRRTHLEEGHGGNFQNESNANMIDKEEMLRKTNRKRVITNELKGASIAAIIGFVTGASIGAIVTLVQNGISPESLKLAALNGGKIGLEGAAFGLINHVASRAIGEAATNSMTGLLGKMGIEITGNITKACNTGIVGSIAIITFSIYQFTKLKKAGYDTKECFVRVGKQSTISVASLAVTVVVQAAYGGPAALAVSVGIGAVMLSYSMYQTYHDKKLSEQIHCYAIYKTCPVKIY